MPVRSTMADLITLVRRMIADPSSGSQQFTDQEVQDRLDYTRDDIRYEDLTIAPTIANNVSTNNQPDTIFSDYYSKFNWWEADVVLQGYQNGQAWIILTPLASDLIIGHWQFTTTPPGQLPPVFATGKVYDCYAAAADLLEFWAATLTAAYNVTVDGQSLQRAQLMMGKLDMAAYYRKLAKPRIMKMNRADEMPPLSSKRMRLLDGGDTVKE